MIRQLTLVVIFLLIFTALTSCGPYLGGNTVTTQYSLDGVKRISEGIASDDTRTWGQTTYAVSGTSRILLRFELLKDYVASIITTSGKTVNILLTLSSSLQLASALSDLKLCPVTKSWMMLASWEVAHPFLGGDPWSARGGDFDSSTCVLGSQVSGTTATLQFDMTTWYLDYPKGRGLNYGVIATSTLPLEFYGDQSASFSPRISFEVLPK